MNLYSSMDELEGFSYEDCIKWLEFNDSNGCYSIDDQLDEFGEIMGIDEMKTLILEQSKEELPQNPPEKKSDLATYFRNDMGIFMETENGVLAICSDEETYQFGEFISNLDFNYDEFEKVEFEMADFSKKEDFFYQREMAESISQVSSFQNWNAILNDAVEMMQNGVEIRSALKQCANDSGIDYGDKMQEFVEWAESQLQ